MLKDQIDNTTLIQMIIQNAKTNIQKFSSIQSLITFSCNNGN